MHCILCGDVIKVSTAGKCYSIGSSKGKEKPRVIGNHNLGNGNGRAITSVTVTAEIQRYLDCIDSVSTMVHPQSSTYSQSQLKSIRVQLTLRKIAVTI